MKTQRTLPVFSLMLGVLLAAVAAAQQQPSSGSTKAASSLVRIRFESPATPLETDALEYLVKSSGLFAAAYRCAANREASLGPNSYAHFESLHRREFDDTIEVEGKISVHLNERDAAGVDESRLLVELVGSLETALAQPMAGERQRLAQRREDAVRRHTDLKATRDALRGHQAQLLQQAGAPVSPLELEKSLIVLQEKRREMELTLVGQRAREEAISKAIAELNARVQERAGQDPVVTELRQVVEIRERIAEKTRARFASSVVSSEDVDRAVESVTLARAELAKARAAASMAAGGDQIAGLSAELTQLSIDAAEMRARAELLTRQTEELRSGPAMKNAVEYDRLAAQLRDVETALSDASEQIRALERHVARLEPPTVTVIGH